MSCIRLSLLATMDIVGLSFAFIFVQSFTKFHHIFLASLENPSGLSTAGFGFLLVTIYEFIKIKLSHKTN